jgi:osmotically-inducible protein OsmY
MIHRHSLTAAGLGIAAAALLACSPTVRATPGASPDPYASPSPAGGDAVDKARAGAEKAGEVIKETAQDVKRDAKPVAKDVGEKVKEGAHETGEVLDAAKQHLDVKAALLADKNVDASHIDVDVDKGAKTVYLRGTVPTAAQKAQAERIARDKAGDYFVRNELTVMAKP